MLNFIFSEIEERFEDLVMRAGNGNRLALDDCFGRSKLTLKQQFIYDRQQESDCLRKYYI